MIRRAFTMRLKPDSLAEYKQHHDNVWPDLVDEIERSGIAQITTFQRGLDLFLFSQINDADSWDRLWTSPVHRRWAELMEPLMHLTDDGIVDAGELTEIFHLQTPAPSKAAGSKPASSKSAPSKPASAKPSSSKQSSSKPGRKSPAKIAKAAAKKSPAKAAKPASKPGKKSKKVAAAKPMKKKSAAKRKSTPARKGR
jgi:L-rhamnose mutarotase